MDLLTGCPVRLQDMCGIAGVVAWDERHRIERQTLERMCHAIAHRGPDGRDLWMDERCGVAFARLAILDLDRRAMQPMTDGKRRLVFNGEIYNFRELRKELERIDPGYAWKTTGDSEVILRAFDAWGETCVDKFNGMFAFAIWEPASGSVFLARDRMGQKPLYFALRSGRGLAFASELPALRSVEWISRDVDLASVSEYLQTGYIPAPATIYRGVSKLPPGCWMRCGADGSVELRKYFDPNEIDGPPISAQSIKTAVRCAVERQLVADVPVGCFLSGGIDSSVIAAAVKSVAKDRPLLTFSIGFDDPRYDETKFAAEVAKHLGTEHRQFTVRSDATADLPKLAAVFGEPFGDSSAIPVHYLSRETRGFVKVALSGDGGDELFGGYDRYRAMRLGSILDSFPKFIGHMTRRAARQKDRKSLSGRIKRFIAAMRLSPPKRYAELVGLFDQDLLEQLFLFRPSAAREVVATVYSDLVANRDVVQAALATDRVTYLPEDLLTKLDRASMLHALEVRSPFMDHELVHMSAGLSTDQLLKGGPKRMLREAFAGDLPDFVFRRKKMGFAVPIGQWLRDSLRPMVEDLLTSGDSFAAAYFQVTIIRQMIDDHSSGKSDHSQRLYALLMLELWWRQR